MKWTQDIDCDAPPYCTTALLPPKKKEEKKNQTQRLLPQLPWMETHANPNDEQIHARLAVNVPEKCDCVTEKEWEAVL